MYGIKSLMLCAVALVATVPATVSADFISVNPEQVFTWKVSEGYRTELEKLQGTNNVCTLELLAGKRERILADAEAVRLLTEEQLVVIHKLHHQLVFDSSFRAGVAALIEQDAADVMNERVTPTEFGGLGIHARGNIELLPIPSGGRFTLYREEDNVPTIARADSPSNGKYVTPEWSRELIPYVFEWHMHSGTFSTQKDLCTPSASFDPNRGWGNDIGYALSRMKANLQSNGGHGVAHNFLFAKMNHRMFSTVYYGGVMDKNGAWFISVVVLPIVAY
jgi:hypothetical protein